MTHNERLEYAIAVGFRDPQLGVTYIRYAEHGDLVVYIQELMRNRPELFHNQSRRQYGLSPRNK